MGCSTTIRWPIPSSSYAANASASSSTDPSNARSSPSSSAGGASSGSRISMPTVRSTRRGVAALRRERRVERLQTLAQTFVRRPEPRRVPRVGVAGGQPQHPRAERGHQDRDVARRRGFEHRVPRRDVVALERHGLAPQQRADDPERLLEPFDAVVLREPERVVLRVVPPGPEAEDQPSTAHLVGGRGHLGHERGVAEARAQDERADLDAFGRGGEGAHDGPGLELAVDRPARGLVEEVVVHPDRIEPVRLGRPRERRDRRPRGPAAAGIARGRGHDHADLHARSV